MSTDDIVKIILGVSLGFAITGISFQIMRLISQFVGVAKEIKRPIENINELSDMALKDYSSIRTFLSGLMDVKKIASKFLGKIAKDDE